MKSSNALATILGMAAMSGGGHSFGGSSEREREILGYADRSFNIIGGLNPNRWKHYPPRSMTPEQREYYDRNKTLPGFKTK